MDTDDIQGYGRKFDNQLRKLDDADIGPDKAAIKRFVHAREGQVNQGTMVNDLNRLRLASERADVPLVEMGLEDVNEFVFDLLHEHELSEGTVRNYRKALRVFFKERDADWAEDIKIGSPERKAVDPEELLEEEEINALLDAASSPRDKCLVSLLADTGLRIGAVASLRIRDVDLSGENAYVSINQDANVKDADGTVPLTWSEGYLTSYLNVHPRRDVPDAALIHKNGSYYDGSDDGALDYQYISRRIKELADAAGVDRERVNTHNFRKTAISRWIREGLSEQAIKHRACWHIDSDMFETYSGVRDEELNDQILSHYDLSPEETSERPDLENCPRCQATLQPNHDFCPGCSAPLTAGAKEAEEAVTEDTLDDIVENPEMAAKLKAVLENSDIAAKGSHGNSSSS